MPTYQFEAPDGRIVEQDFPFGKAPSIGETLLIDGVPCTRVVSSYSSVPQRTVEPFVGIQMRPWEPGAKRYITDPKHPLFGQPVFANRSEAEAFADRSDGKWVYDALPTAGETRFRADQKQKAWDRFPLVDGDAVRPEDLLPEDVARERGIEQRPVEELPQIRPPRPDDG